MDTLTHVGQLFAYLWLPPLRLMMAKKSRRSPPRLLMCLFPYSSLIGCTTVSKRAFLFAFERHEHVRGEWVRKRIQPGLFHDQVKIAQGCAHDLERTLSQRRFTGHDNLNSICISLGADLALETVTMERNQRLAQLLWRRIPGPPALREEREVGLEASEVCVSRAQWPLILPLAMPFCERNNDSNLLIEKVELVEVSWLAAHPTNL